MPLALLGLTLGALVLAAPLAARAQAGKPAAGEMRWGLHVTLAAHGSPTRATAGSPASPTRPPSRISA